MDYKFCPKCGNKLPKDALFCNSCGEKMPTVQQERSNVVNSSQPESITTQVPSTPKVEEQRVSNDNSVESREETQKSGTMRFFFSIIFYCALLYFFSGVSLFGVIIMAAIAYLSYRFFIKKLFVAKSWSLKFVPELCFIIGFVAVSALFGGGISSSSGNSSSSSSGKIDNFTGTYTLKTIDRVQVAERATSDKPGKDIQYVIHPNGSVVFFHGNTNYGIVGEVDKITKDAVYLYIEYKHRYNVLVKTTDNNTKFANGQDLVLDKSSGKFFFSVKDYENQEVITPTTARFEYSSDIRK